MLSCAQGALLRHSCGLAEVSSAAEPLSIQKKMASSDPLAAALAERINSNQGASASGHDRSGSDASDDWEEVCMALPMPMRPIKLQLHYSGS